VVVLIHGLECLEWVNLCGICWSIRLKKLSLKDVYIVSTDGNVSNVNDVTKDVSFFKDELLDLFHR
jgi:hypothetical protein